MINSISLFLIPLLCHVLLIPTCSTGHFSASMVVKRILLQRKKGLSFHKLLCSFCYVKRLFCIKVTPHTSPFSLCLHPWSSAINGRINFPSTNKIDCVLQLKHWVRYVNATETAVCNLSEFYWCCKRSLFSCYL